MRTVRDGGETRRIADGSLAVVGTQGMPLAFFPPPAGTAVLHRTFGPIDLGLIDFGLKEPIMGRGILLWLLGVPIPIIILLALFFR
jgi:hypothetical protein